MDCPSNLVFFQRLNQKIIKERIPFNGGLELTSHCNLKCTHCYVSPTFPELTTAQWLNIIDQVKDAGCMELLFTGGEPFLRKDFKEIYTHAKKTGILVIIFSNGTLINDDIIKLLQDFPPYIIEISLYGASAAVYEKITQVSGSFNACMNGIHKLLDAGIHLRLKTMLLTTNQHEFDEIKKTAKDLGVKFRFDGAIFPRFNGDQTPIHLRVSPEEVVKKEFSDPERSRQWADYYNRTRNNSELTGLYNCGAGVSMFHIDAHGLLYPCLMARSIKYNLLNGTFKNGWNLIIPKIRKLEIGRSKGCNVCEKISLCGFCPGFSSLENGSEDIVSQYLCSFGEERWQQINNYLKEVN